MYTLLVEFSLLIITYLGHVISTAVIQVSFFLDVHNNFISKLQGCLYIIGIDSFRYDTVDTLVTNKY